MAANSVRPPPDHPAPDGPRRARKRPSWYAVGTVIGLLRLVFDLVLAFVAPRAALIAENLILRQQLIVVRRQINALACADSIAGSSVRWRAASTAS